MKILVSGSLAYDRIMEYAGKFSDHIMPEKIHTLSLSFVTDEFRENFGGTAGNIAYGLALLGEKPEILSVAGKDFESYKDWLLNLGVGLNFLKIFPDKSTAVVNIFTDRADNQIAAVCLGTLAYSCEFSEEKIEGDSFAIVAPGNSDDMKKLPETYKKNGVPYIFDPGQQIPSLSENDLKEGIKGSKALMSNDYELALILNKTGWSEEYILNNTEMIITTLGEKGSVAKTKDGVFEIPAAKPKEILDPTGAGDAYRAGLIKGLVHNWPIEVAGRFGSVMAAYAVETHGTQEYSTSFEEAAARYEENFKEKLPN